MSFSVQTTNRFSVFIDEDSASKQKQQPKKAEAKPKAKQQPKVEKKTQKKQAPPARKPKSPEYSGPITTDDGFTAVVDKRDRRKPKAAPKKETGQTRKRNYDRHVSGTGRGKEVKRRGQGKANWGNPVEAGVEDAQERLNRPRHNKNRVRKPKPAAEAKPEKKEAEATEPKEPTEEEKLRQEEEEKRRKEEEEEKKKLTLDQYLKKQKAQRPKVKKTNTRRPGEGETADAQKNFQAISKPSEDTVVQLKNKKETSAKSHSKKSKKEKKVALTDFLKDAPKPKSQSKPGRKTGGRPGSRGRQAPAIQSQPNLADESSFPSLG